MYINGLCEDAKERPEARSQQSVSFILVLPIVGFFKQVTELGSPSAFVKYICYLFTLSWGIIVRLK